MRIKNISTIFILCCLAQRGACQFFEIDRSDWKLFSPEIRLNTPGFQFRSRPTHFGINSNSSRSDIMLGKKINRSILFIYGKYAFDFDDSKQKIHLGARFDFNRKIWSGRSFLNLQIRMFKGLNSISPNQLYLVQYFDYNLYKKLEIGFLGYTQINLNKNAWSYFGPLVKYDFSKKFNTFIHLGNDVLNSENWFLLIRHNFLFNANYKDES
ncbi:MAG: hypothetical protein CNE98_01590 [Bacteroidetes bacterium MED-G17]|nr:MAG: hypothetical protein CBB99_01540 [Bacteroidetes bacterium TMED39]PDH53293.1 MAG: hypothetical protein CNE98_01590 [Bacteroidetes bacterium MED-G17]CAI8335044.1 MAG: Uncharacterised protein [Bacteroidetes bacterium MED-G17]